MAGTAESPNISRPRNMSFDRVSIARPLNTSIQIPPPAPSQLVSPISLNGSPTPTPGTEQRQMFWGPNPTPVEERKAPWSVGNTPNKEKRRGFWSPTTSPSNDKRAELWAPPKTPAMPVRRSETVKTTTTTTMMTAATAAVAASASHKPKGQNVSWSDSSLDSDRSKGHSSQEADSSQSDNSRANSPARPERVKTPNTASSSESLAAQRARARVIQLIDKKKLALARDPSPTPLPKEPPFVAYTDTFLQMLGLHPKLEQVLEDSRAPFFGGSGCFHRPTSTLFLTSSLLKDSSPGMASSRNYNITTTSVTFYSDTDYTRDKVRFSDNHMPGGACVWHPAASMTSVKPQTSSIGKRLTHSSQLSGSFTSSLVMCSRGTLGVPAGLIQVAPRRPHTVTPLLTSYPNGRHFNSPHSVIALSDGSLVFTDPPVGYEVGYRPRPKMPPLVHRFDPATGDVRALADGLTRPTCIAVSPDERTLYVVDAPRPRKEPGKGRHFEDVLDACCAPMPTIQAYTLVGVTQGIGVGGSGVFLTNKRLFAFPGVPSDCEPTGLAVSGRGDIFVACGSAGVLVYSKDGTLIGKIRCGEGESFSGVCCGRKGELFCYGGTKVWQITMETARLG